MEIEKECEPMLFEFPPLLLDIFNNLLEIEKEWNTNLEKEGDGLKNGRR